MFTPRERVRPIRLNAALAVGAADLRKSKVNERHHLQT